MKLCWQHRLTRLSISIHLYHPSLQASPPNYILCPHRAYVNKFLLLAKHWHSTYLVCFTCMFLWMGGKWPSRCLFCIASKIYSKYLVAFLCSFYLTFSLCILLGSMWCIHTVVLIQRHLGRNPIFFYQKWSITYW